MAKVDVLNEVSKKFDNGYTLCFQYCKYIYDKPAEGEEDSDKGYRFIWKRDDNTFQAARGQARIYSIPDILELVGKAIADGWGIAPFPMEKLPLPNK